MFFVHDQRLRAAIAGAIAVTLAAAVLPSPAIAGGQGGGPGAAPPAAVPAPTPVPGAKAAAKVSPYSIARRRQMAASTDGAHAGSKEAASPMMKLQNRRTHPAGQQSKAR